MDYKGLIQKFLAFACLSVGFTGCVTQQMQSTVTEPKTFLVVSVVPKKAFSMSEQFLEWHKGYSIRIRDLDRGLAVTDWTFDSPSERHRVTLKTTADRAGSSLISAHTETQVLEEQDWHDLPSTGQRESLLLTELKKYIEHR